MTSTPDPRQTVIAAVTAIATGDTPAPELVAEIHAMDRHDQNRIMGEIVGYLILRVADLTGEPPVNALRPLALAWAATATE